MHEWLLYVYFGHVVFKRTGTPYPYNALFDDVNQARHGDVRELNKGVQQLQEERV